MEIPLLVEPAAPFPRKKSSWSRKLFLAFGSVSAVAVCALAIVGAVTLANLNSSQGGETPIQTVGNDVVAPVTPIGTYPSDHSKFGDEPIPEEYQASQTCVCPRVTYQIHEEVLLSQDRNICVGGCGGQMFAAHGYAELVRTLTVFFEDDVIMGIQVELSNGVSQTFGGDISSSKLLRESFSFQLGEYIVGDMILGSNNPWFSKIRSSFISFATSTGRTFEVGLRKNLFYFPANGRFLSGVFGRHSSNGIDSLGFIFVRPIRSTKLTNVSYPTLNLLPTAFVPNRLARTVFVNDAPNELKQTVTYTRTIGESNCWTHRHVGLFGATTSVSVGLLSLAKVGAGLRWEVTQESMHAECINKSTTEATATEIRVPANNRCEVEVTQQTSPIDRLPFSADLELTFNDGTSQSFRTSGTYTAIAVSQEVVERKCTALRR
eukprot:c38809_g1_i1.p1 GENE.c38809_g1_i1~~c38809_g1_i1.p1  ORF type:complete len:434 (+),score=73.29 c38809_g1_i1:28-1329(+)